MTSPVRSPRRARSSSARAPLTRCALGLGVCAVLFGCESEGFTPDCPPMPLVGGGPNAPALVEWRKEAVAKKCVTPPGRGFGGAPG